MQKINPTQPSIPVGLKVPNPKTPWNVSDDLFQRLQNQPSNPQQPYKKCEVLPSDPEIEFVKEYFWHHKPNKYGIKKIYCIHNPDQTQNFESGIKAIEQEAENPVFKPKWKNEDLQQERENTIQRWKEATSQFSPFKIKSPKRTDKFEETKIVPLWHGTNQQVCNSICSSGFTFFGKVNDSNSTDIGYFGSGIYFTNSASYATMYGSDHLILAWVSMREPYPVVNNIPHPNKGADMKKLQGQGHYQNYNAHYIPVASINPNSPSCMEYYPCYNNQPPAWDELVVFQKNQTLARLWVELVFDGLLPSGPKPKPPVNIPQIVLPSIQQPPSNPVNPPVSTISSPQIPLIAFGKAKWELYFGDVGDEPPLPPDIHEILEGPCPFFPGKKLKKTHMLILIPKEVNKKALTLNSLEELIKNPKKGVPSKYNYDMGQNTLVIKKEYGDVPIQASYWALITRDVFPESMKLYDLNKNGLNYYTIEDKSHSALMQLLDNYSKQAKVVYEMPRLLEVAVSVFMEYFQTGTQLYSSNKSLNVTTYTCCLEKLSIQVNKNYFHNQCMFVGGLSSSQGLTITVHPPKSPLQHKLIFGVGGARRL
jgi:hypothetical protein